jgi:hypothetical protein
MERDAQLLMVKEMSQEMSQEMSYYHPVNWVAKRLREETIFCVDGEVLITTNAAWVPYRLKETIKHVRHVASQGI